MLSFSLAVGVFLVAFENPALARQVRFFPKAIVGVPVASSPICFSYCPGGNVKRFDGIFGGGLEVGLWGSFSAEIDSLYKPKRYRHLTGSVRDLLPGLPGGTYATTISEDMEGHSWEFPLMLKKTWATGGRTTPYTLGGFVVGRTTGTTYFSEIDTVVGNYTAFQSSGSSTQTGILLGGGVALRWRRLRLSPEGRYTEWLRKEMPGDVWVDRSVDFVLGISIEK